MTSSTPRTVELAAHVVHRVGPEGRAPVGHHLPAAHLVVDLLGEAREGIEGVDLLGQVPALEQAGQEHRRARPVHAALDDVAGTALLHDPLEDGELLGRELALVPEGAVELRKAQQGPVDARAGHVLLDQLLDRAKGGRGLRHVGISRRAAGSPPDDRCWRPEGVDEVHLPLRDRRAPPAGEKPHGLPLHDALEPGRSRPGTHRPRRAHHVLDEVYRHGGTRGGGAVARSRGGRHAASSRRRRRG